MTVPDDLDTQHRVADLAADTLAIITRYHDALDDLRLRLHLLAEWTEARHPELCRDGVAQYQFLHFCAMAIGSVQTTVPEALADVAQALPMRGLEY
jgi:hypothetical protein